VLLLDGEREFSRLLPLFGEENRMVETGGGCVVLCVYEGIKRD